MNVEMEASDGQLEGSLPRVPSEIQIVQVIGYDNYAVSAEDRRLLL